MSPRHDLQYRNRDIAHMLKGLYEQAQYIAGEISVLEARVTLQPMDEPFRDIGVRDVLTSVALAVQNLSGEVTRVWKRTR